MTRTARLLTTLAAERSPANEQARATCRALVRCGCDLRPVLTPRPGDIRARAPHDSLSARAKNAGKGKKTADEWNQ